MSAPVLHLNLLGIGVWAEGIGNWAEARATLLADTAAADAPVAVQPAAAGTSAAHRPPTTLLPPTERRRAPTTVLLALNAAEQACSMAGLSPAELPSVFASSQGDLDIMHYICEVLAESPEHLSPTKFHNSVHNAASGYWTIGTGCMQASTAVSAWSTTFAHGLLEAATQALCADAPVLLVAYDMPAVGPLVSATDPSDLLGMALVVSPATPGMPQGWGGISLQTQVVERPQAPPAAALDTAAGMRLLRALAGDQPGQVALPLTPGLDLLASLAIAPASPG